MSERPPYAGLTPDEIEAIAERAAERALEHVYAQVGKNVLKKLAWLTGLVVVSLLIWLGSKGAITP